LGVPGDGAESQNPVKALMTTSGVRQILESTGCWWRRRFVQAAGGVLEDGEQREEVGAEGVIGECWREGVSERRCDL